MSAPFVVALIFVAFLLGGLVVAELFCHRHDAQDRSEPSGRSSLPD